MRDNFINALKYVLESEGGWADSPLDPGGATMRGITLGTYRDYMCDQTLTKDDLQSISDEKLREIYKQRYWNKVKGNELPIGIDYMVFDFAVHSGPGQAVRTMQEVLCVVKDGIIGPKTLSALTRCDPKTFIQKYMDARETFLRRLNKPWFIKGWLKRLGFVTANINEMRR
jgi:lysozyme family protein